MSTGNTSLTADSTVPGRHSNINKHSSLCTSPPRCGKHEFTADLRVTSDFQSLCASTGASLPLTGSSAETEFLFWLVQLLDPRLISACGIPAVAILCVRKKSRKAACVSWTADWWDTLHHWHFKSCLCSEYPAWKVTPPDVVCHED